MSDLSNDAYGRTITMSSDGVTDTYVAGGAVAYQFPTGTSQAAVYLSIAQQWNLALMNIALTDFINNHYSSETRLRWVQNWIESFVNNWSQRLAYVNTLVAWGASVSTYVAGYIQTVMALSDPNQVAATQWNFASLEGADPQINLLTYIAKGTS